MSRKLLVVTLVAAASGLILVFGLHEPPPVYARSVSEFVAHPLRDRPVRVQGVLVPGSLCHVVEPCEYRLRLRDRAWQAPSSTGAELAVSYRSCVIPDDFVEALSRDLEVAAEGELCATCHVFEASTVLVRSYRDYRLAPEPVSNRRILGDCGH